MSSGFNRRDFSKAAVTAAAAGAASTLAPARVLGASDQVRLGFIGVGNRGCQLLKAFLAHPDAKIGTLCDVYAPYLNAEYDKVDPRFASLGQRIPRMAELPADVARVKDFRTVLDRPDIDAVVIATPDHWHAIQTIAACKAGKRANQWMKRQASSLQWFAATDTANIEQQSVAFCGNRQRFFGRTTVRKKTRVSPGFCVGRSGGADHGGVRLKA